MSFFFLKIACLFRHFTLFILSSISAGGYLCVSIKFLNSSSLLISVLVSEIINLNLLAKSYGILFLVCFGWHEVYSRYFFESVGL